MFYFVWHCMGCHPCNPSKHTPINYCGVTLCLRHCDVLLHFSVFKGYSDTTMSQNAWLHYKPEAHKDISGFTVVVITLWGCFKSTFWWMSNKQNGAVARNVTFRRMCISVSPHTAISFVWDIRNLIPWNNGINKGRRCLEVRCEYLGQL
jgi:hypothetical protein